MMTQDDRLLSLSFLDVIASFALCIILFAVPCEAAPAGQSGLPEEVIAAFLGSHSDVTLYSIEPEEVRQNDFHGYRILGQARISSEQVAAAIQDIRQSVDTEQYGGGLCFNPHHGLSARADGHTYDLVICYLCGVLAMYRDGQFLGPALNITGSPQVLNRISAAYGLPKSRHLAESENASWQGERDRKRWLRVTPRSVRGMWNDYFEGKVSFAGSSGLDPMRGALEAEFPDEKARIRALFAWYGSGAGSWSGHPGYEKYPALLLQELPLSDLLEVTRSGDLTIAQLQGAVRFLGIYMGEGPVRDRRELRKALARRYQVVDGWLSAMPSAIRPLWRDEMWYYGGRSELVEADKARMMSALEREFPDKGRRILALFSWYGSGVGVLQEGHPFGYEGVAAGLLYGFSTAELSAALQSADLDKKQLHGAARLFARRDYQIERPGQLTRIPVPVKADLLAHIAESDNRNWKACAAGFESGEQPPSQLCH
jgi:hypothetical protein